MRSVEIRDAAGCRLGCAVKDERGRVLLAPGTPLTGGLCDALVRRGFLQVLVFDGIADDVSPKDTLSATTRSLALHTARESFQQASRGDALPVQVVLRAVDLIMEDISSARGAVLEFATLRSVSDYTYMHSVNTCVYSLLIGQAIGVTGTDLRSLGTGALLHDVGKILCADLCTREGPLSPEDWVRIKQHPIDGFEMLRQHHELHLFAAHIAYQHHERMDGSGYPRGLVGSKILPFARIVAVADVFDAANSDRPHARGRSLNEAMAEVRDGSGTLFDVEVVRAFMRRMAVYPSGTPVLLLDGTVAVVVAQGQTPQEPVVRLMGRAGHVFAQGEEVRAEGERAVSQVLAQWPGWLRGRVTAP